MSHQDRHLTRFEGHASALRTVQRFFRDELGDEGHALLRAIVPGPEPTTPRGPSLSPRAEPVKVTVR